jgi:cytochrome c
MAWGRAAFRRAATIAVCLLAGPAPAQDLVGHGGPVSALAAGDGTVLSGGFDGRVILWNPDTAQARQVLRFHDGNVTAVALLPDGRFATGGQDGRIALWDGSGREPVLSTPSGVSPVSALAVAPDGTRLAAGFWTGQVQVVALADATVRQEQAHADRVSGLAYLPSGDLVSVGADLRFTRWDAGLAPLARAGLPDLPNGLAITGDRLAVIFAEGAVRLLSPDGDVLPERFLSERPLVAVAAGPGTVAAAAVDGSVWVLDPETLVLRAEIPGGNGPVWALAIQGDTLFAAGMAGTIRRHSTLDGARLGEAATPGAAEYTDDSRGAEVWRACAVCHSLTAGDHSRAGPSLHGIFDRPIASVEGYEFSPALHALDIVWSPETVAELFEVGPEVYTPGSRMPDQRVADPADRQALVEFLERASR